MIMENYNAPELAINAEHKALIKSGLKLKQGTAYAITRTHKHVYKTYIHPRPPPPTHTHTNTATHVAAELRT